MIQVNSTPESASDPGQPGEGIFRSVKTRAKLATGVSAGGSAWPMKELTEDIPPWEKLHINNVGGFLVQPMESFGSDLPRDDIEKSNSMDRVRKNTDTTLVDRSSRGSVDSNRTDRRNRSIGESEGDYNIMVETDGTLDYIPEGQTVHSRRALAQPSILVGSTTTPQSGLLRTDLLNNGFTSSTTASPYNLPYNGTSRRVSIDQEAIMQDERKNVLIPLPSSSTGKSLDSSEDDDMSVDNDNKDPNHQTLHEFFAQTQPSLDDQEQRARKDDDEDLDPRDSAASYFNRQASLLMLYFPLAYLIVFTFSLVRLLYDMITHKPNPIMTMVSLWFVLSVGLVDAAIYVSLYKTRSPYLERVNDLFHRHIVCRAGLNGECEGGYGGTCPSALLCQTRKKERRTKTPKIQQRNVFCIPHRIKSSMLLLDKFTPTTIPLSSFSSVNHNPVNPC
jgi:hypothetical protein